MLFISILLSGSHYRSTISLYPRHCPLPGCSLDFLPKKIAIRARIGTRATDRLSVRLRRLNPIRQEAPYQIIRNLFLIASC